MPWIETRVKAFVAHLEPLGCADETSIAQLCEQEIAAWRARGLAQASLNSPMTAMRNAIKRIELTEQNTWINPRTQQPEHLALKYMNFSKDEWHRIKSSTTQTVFERMAHQQFLDQPEAFVRLVSALLEQDAWPELAVGVLAASGRRLSEGLVTASFRSETLYSVLFTGQLKQPVANLSYEIPTLVPASVLLSALERLRHHQALKAVSTLTLNQVAHRYGPKVRETARAVFQEVLPARTGKRQLTTHDLRAAYARIAVHWFCPPEVSDRLYAATILGHLQGALSQEEAFERMATEEHYADYLIGDGHGNQNGLKGIKLKEPGVVMLKVFQPLPVSQEAFTASVQQGHEVTMRKKRPVRFTLHVDASTHERVVQRKRTLQLPSINDVIETLLDTSERQNQGSTPLTPEQLGLPPELIEQIHVAMECSGEQSFVAFLEKALAKESHIRIGTAQRYKEVDLTQLRTSQLEKQQKSASLAQERIRRAVITLMLYNQQQTNPKLRAAITQNAVHNLVGGRFDHIRAFLEKYHDAILAHQKALEIPEKRSGNVNLHAIVIPEEPEVFAPSFLSVS